MDVKIIRLGTRGSTLAQIQTRLAADRIREHFPEIKIQVVPVKTFGDTHQQMTLGSTDGKGVFTKELEEALLDGRIDLAVHSCKDLPVQLPQGLAIGAVLPRTCRQEAFVVRAQEKRCRTAADIGRLPADFIVGTGSRRRQMQLQALCAGIQTVPIRGNVQTRLRKLAEGTVDAVVLAQAGLERLFTQDSEFDYTGFHYIYLDPQEFLPAATQGILAVEGRRGEFTDLLAAINDPRTFSEYEAERAFLRGLDCGCSAPAAALACRTQDSLHMQVWYAPEGQPQRRLSAAGSPQDPAGLGERLARILRTAVTEPGTVYLAGAGPGDPGLMTQKACAVVRRADVVLYDLLAPVGILNEAKPHAELLDAGKSTGKHMLSQEEINLLLAEYALQGKCVVRLKGGDPFIFGRGGEEGLFLSRAGVPFEVIPGVSSASAAAASVGIPLTHRGAASSFHVITGHEDPYKMAAGPDPALLARQEGTLVYLMGMHRLPDICRQLLAGGKDGETPAAVIQNGTRAHQRAVFGTLATIAERARRKEIKAPAVLVVGLVADLHKELAAAPRGPLSGRCVLLTGTREMNGRLSALLSDEGAEPLPVSLIETRPLVSAEIRDLLTGLSRFTWVVFTSRNGVRIFFEQLRTLQVDLRSLHGLRFAAIGSQTAQELAEHGIFCDFVPDRYSSREMAESFVPQLCGQDNVLLLRAKQASEELMRALAAADVPFVQEALYETVVITAHAPLLLRQLSQADDICFCSVSAVHAFVQLGGEEGLRTQQRIVCIGPQTAAAACAAFGKQRILTAQTYTAEGIADIMCRDCLQAEKGAAYD